jgi:outer membrane lipoprotein carrier protein
MRRLGLLLSTGALLGLGAQARAASPRPGESPEPKASVTPSPSPSPSATPRPSASPQPSARPKAPPVAKIPSRLKLPALLEEVEAHYAQTNTLKAKFNQVNQTQTGKPKKLSGTVQFKRPDKFRWEVLKPDPSISISNGTTAWLYTPPFDEEDHGQVIERPASEVQTKLANALLSGRFSAIREMKITPEGKSGFSLVPRRGSAGTVRRAHIDIDPATKLIQKVTLEHAGGNRSEFTLSEIEFGASIPDDVFNFKIPPNTDRAEP